MRASAKAKPHGNKTQARANSKPALAGKSGWTSFVQGITLGAVLLIPVGVWCWVRADEVAPAVEAQVPAGKAKAAKGKSLPVAKRKPMRLSPAPAPRAVSSVPVGVGMPEPPPFVPVPVPTPGVAPLATTVPHLDQDINTAPPPKKGLWKTITSPFRTKSKDAPARNEPTGEN